MNTSFYIAKRYFSSKKKKNVVHVISLISLIGICIGTMALVCVLSVYNGFGKVIEELNSVFNPSLLIEAKEGKTFHLSAIPLKEIEHIKGVSVISPCVEESAWILYKKKEAIVTLKGVSDVYSQLNDLTPFLIKGDGIYKDEYNNYAVLGASIYFELGVSVKDFSHYMMVNIPKRKKTISLEINDNFNSGYLSPSGMYSVQDDVDKKYVLTHIDFVRKLLDYSSDEVTSLEIGFTDKARPSAIQQQLKKLLGENYTVKNRYEQQELYYKIFKSEKVAIYLILLFILFIATFNLIGSIYLLIIDKKKDIFILKSMGMPFQMIRKIFFWEGMIVSGVGTILGVFLGVGICALQQFFGFIKMGEGSFVIDVFPVHVQFTDILIISVLVFFISIISVGITVSKMKNTDSLKS